MSNSAIPPYLKQGDTVALIAPSGVIPTKQAFVEAELWLSKLGLNSIRGTFAAKKYGTYSATDQQRLNDLQKALDNPKIKAIWAVRGGYGAMRIVTQLNLKQFLKQPKWLIGFSDITTFHNLLSRYKIESLHAVMPIQLTKASKVSMQSLETLETALFGKSLNYRLETTPKSRLGKAKGKLVGGNLSLITALLGTPYQLKVKNKILFLEEVGEYAYRVNRQLCSLKLAGYFDGLSGLILGGFTDIKSGEFNQSYQDMILEITKNTDYPIYFDFPSGHMIDNRALILGRKIKLLVKKNYSKIEFKSK